MSAVPFEESFRELVSVARKFVWREASFMQFYGSCAQARRDTAGVSIDDRILEMINDWSKLSERCRNEWGEQAEPLSEEEVRNELKRQLDETVAQLLGAGDSGSRISNNPESGIRSA